MMVYEYRDLHLPSAVSRSQARTLLAEQAEYEHWELDRVRLFAGGVRKVRLRRKIIRVQQTV